MYELEPAPGLKASRAGLSDDIARLMSALVCARFYRAGSVIALKFAQRTP
jgi:hypothetical protein